MVEKLLQPKNTNINPKGQSNDIHETWKTDFNSSIVINILEKNL
jgi:hypothetical protein